MWSITPMIGVGLAALLGLIIGCEREFFGKAAGIRTNTLVAMGAALFTEISRYGFLDVLADGAIRGDPGRVAAQIVTGVGFLGAGLIFVRRDAVRGLTTAAGIWLVAAIGMAAGAGLYLVAVASTALYLLIMIGTRPLGSRIPHSHSLGRTFDITYADGQGVLRRIIEAAAQVSVTIVDFAIVGDLSLADRPAQRVSVTTVGTPESLKRLGEDLMEMPGVFSVRVATEATS